MGACSPETVNRVNVAVKNLYNNVAKPQHYSKEYLSSKIANKPDIIQKGTFSQIRSHLFVVLGSQHSW